MMDNRGKKSNKQISVLGLILIVVAMGVFGFSAYKVYDFYKPDVEARSEVQDLIDTAIGTFPPEFYYTPVPSDSLNPTETDTEEPVVTELFSDLPSTDEPGTELPLTTEPTGEVQISASPVPTEQGNDSTKAPNSSTETTPTASSEPTSSAETTASTPAPIPSPTPHGSEDVPATTPSPTQNNIPAGPFYVDFSALQSINSDICAWLYNEDTPINYPVMYSNDNIYYLDHLYNGSYNSGGSLFVDYRCSRYFTDVNTLIFGHNNKSGSMFGSLKGYKNQNYYNKHPYMWLFTPAHTYRLDLICGLITKSNSDPYTLFSSSEELQAFLRRAVSESTFDSGIDIDSIDRVVTLSTCSYEFNKARFVVIGHPVPLN